MFSEFRKNPDWMGLGFVYISLSYPFLSVLTGIILSVRNRDLLFLFISVISKNSCQNFYIFHIFRYIYLQIQLQWFLLNARAALFVGTGMSVMYLRKLNSLLNASILRNGAIWGSIKKYRELSLLLTMVSNHANNMFGQALSILFLMVAFGVCGIIYGFRAERYLLILIVGTVMFAAISFCILLLNIGSLLYNISRRILFKWEKACKQSRGYGSRQLQKSVNCLRLLYVKAGSVSVMTNRLKQGYFDALLQDTCALTLIFKEYWL